MWKKILAAQVVVEPCKRIDAYSEFLGSTLLLRFQGSIGLP
jgi:hypothetical protein